jgi:hypothetical protein
MNFTTLWEHAATAGTTAHLQQQRYVKMGRDIP